MLLFVRFLKFEINCCKVYSFDNASFFFQTCVDPLRKVIAICARWLQLRTGLYFLKKSKKC
jgi:hypothetical protein